MSGTKSVSVTTDIIPAMTKIKGKKLNWSNFHGWSKTVRVYLRSINKAYHLTNNPPDDNTKEAWLTNDARIFLQLRNSIDGEILPLIDHCEYVKELMDYLDFMYSGKGNISRIYDVCQSFHCIEQQDQSLIAYFMNFKRTYEELNVLLPFSPDVTVQQAQREQIAVMSFLAGLRPEFESVKSQNLSSPQIPMLQETFSRVVRNESTPLVAPSQLTNALIS
ncbi:uncharacterized protein LOC125369315 [Ricinus communis]|uniref:uncharacterized protein LOC125369315 n=1 Tax=Ricinus communis TaxID=3988 RepID=UPI00201B3383|nr:uncharacterized protein LOC125369315 [Ricinus communis]